METWEPPQGWQAWTEELDLLRWVPRPAFVRPDNLGSLGRDSYLIEPYRIDCPDRVHIGNDVVIGERSSLSAGPSVLEHSPEIRIGDKIRIGSDLVVDCPGGLEIVSRVGFSARVTVGGDHRADRAAPGIDASPVRIEEEVIVGTGATIRSGISIGRHAYIGAGAVVTHDVPPFAVVFGDPGRVIRRWDEKRGRWRLGG